MLALAIAEERTEGFNVWDLEPGASSPSITAVNGPAYPASATYTYDHASGAILYEEFHPYGSSAYRAVDSSIGVSAKRYRYTAKERDEETGLDHMGARYYAPWLGRWTAADPLGLADGINRYRYARANPTTVGDPTGTKSWADRALDTLVDAETVAVEGLARAGEATKTAYKRAATGIRSGRDSAINTIEQATRSVAGETFGRLAGGYVAVATAPLLLSATAGDIASTSVGSGLTAPKRLDESIQTAAQGIATGNLATAGLGVSGALQATGEIVLAVTGVHAAATEATQILSQARGALKSGARRIGAFLKRNRAPARVGADLPRQGAQRSGIVEPQSSSPIAPDYACGLRVCEGLVNEHRINQSLHPLSTEEVAKGIGQTPKGAPFENIRQFLNDAGLAVTRMPKPKQVTPEIVGEELERGSKVVLAVEGGGPATEGTPYHAVVAEGLAEDSAGRLFTQVHDPAVDVPGGGAGVVETDLEALVSKTLTFFGVRK